jgi:hypothetical protein
MHRGYVKLWRKSMDSAIWQNADLWKVWCWCMMKANHTEKWVSVVTGKGAREIKLEPGQFVYGRFEAAKELKMRPTTVRDRMKKLAHLEALTQKSATHCTIVTLCNWSLYAAGENETRHRPATDPPPTRHRPATTKNDKNVKNGQETQARFVPPTVEDVAAYCRERKNSVDPQRFVDHYSSNGWRVGRNPMKDWKAAVRTWEKNDFRSKPGKPSAAFHQDSVGLDPNETQDL